MKIERNEIRTGLLVILSLGAFVAVLIYLGSPGVFVPQKTFRIYFDNAAALKPGADVLLAGRKIGRVKRIFSPVPANERPDPKMEALVEVQVEAAASIYQRVKVTVSQPNLLAEPMIDFVGGDETSGWAPEGQSFLGERPASLTDLVPTVVEKLEPTLEKATAILDSLQKTVDNLTKMTDEGGDLSKAFSQFRQITTNVNKLSGDTGPLGRSLANIEAMTAPDGKLSTTLDSLQALTGPEGALAKTLANAEKFTSSLADNKDAETALRNFRQTTEKLNGTIGRLGPRLDVISANLVDASETVKHQPWRLIWRGTKEYPEDEAQQKPAPKSTATSKSKAASKPKGSATSKPPPKGLFKR